MARRRRITLALAGLAAAALLAGCGASTRQTELGTALADYNAGRYEQALDRAETVRRSSFGEPRHEAAYLGGLAAYKLGHHDAARTYFTAASESADPELRGKAEAMLGTVALDTDRDALAADHFESASRRLDPADARRAVQYATVARGEGPLENSGFAVQLGAFSAAENAARAARLFGPRVRSLGFTTAHVIPTHDDRGRPRFLVQVGPFTTKQDARAARTQLGEPTAFVTAFATD